jgi:hypothetical protein
VLDLVEVAARKPETLEELYRHACLPPGPRAVQAWIFREAKARGRLAVAEREMKELETQRFCILSKTWGTDSDAARDLLMRHGPSGIEIGQAEAELATAVELVSACGRMIELLSRQPPTKETPNGKPTDDLTARVQQRQQARQSTPTGNVAPAPGRQAPIVIPPQRGGIG